MRIKLTAENCFTTTRMAAAALARELFAQRDWLGFDAAHLPQQVELLVKRALRRALKCRGWDPRLVGRLRAAAIDAAREAWGEDAHQLRARRAAADQALAEMLGCGPAEVDGVVAAELARRRSRSPRRLELAEARP